MSTHYRDCELCGEEIGSAHDGYVEGFHPECLPEEVEFTYHFDPAFGDGMQHWVKAVYNGESHSACGDSFTSAKLRMIERLRLLKLKRRGEIVVPRPEKVVIK